MTTRPLVAKNPGFMGTTQTREFAIDGASLTLVQKAPAGQGINQTTTTRLKRLE